jgi:hypothetical protein
MYAFALVFKLFIDCVFYLLFFLFELFLLLYVFYCEVLSFSLLSNILCLKQLNEHGIGNNNTNPVIPTSIIEFISLLSKPNSSCTSSFL